MSEMKMVGGTYLHNGVEHIIRDVEPLGDGQVRVRTNKKVITVDKSRLRKEFLPVDDARREDQLIELYGFQKDETQMTALAEVLLDNIKKCQNNPTFIEQARAINENARTLIEMQKVKIDMLKLIRER